MSNPLPQTNQCRRCKEWFHTVHVCSKDINVMPINCTTATLCRKHGCHGECLPTPTAAPAYVPLSEDEVEKLGHRECWRYAHSTDPAHSSTYTFNLMCLLDFARHIESLVVARMKGAP